MFFILISTTKRQSLRVAPMDLSPTPLTIARLVYIPNFKIFDVVNLCMFIKSKCLVKYSDKTLKRVCAQSVLYNLSCNGADFAELL